MVNICNTILKFLSGNGHKVPLLSITIDIDKYHKAVEGSATCHFNPDFRDDIELKMMVSNMIDYIRSHYDMDKLLTVEKNEKKQ